MLSNTNYFYFSITTMHEINKADTIFPDYGNRGAEVFTLTFSYIPQLI